MGSYPTDNGRVSRQKELLNYRLSTARPAVQCAFAIGYWLQSGDV